MQSETEIMGILNVTPDSFSDGGTYIDPGLACARIEYLTENGADIVDIGAESTRPGSFAVTEGEEWQRLQPVLAGIQKSSFKVRLSVDTQKASIMRRVLDYGVTIINDVSGGADDATLEFLASEKITYIAMHRHGDSQTMQAQPLTASNARRAAEDFYETTYNRLLRLGFSDDSIWLDPGIGFGKTDAANIQLIDQAYDLCKSYHLAVGVSRKSFVGRLLQIDDTLKRDPPSKFLELGLIFAGVKAVRTHEVKTLRHLRDQMYLTE